MNLQKIFTFGLVVVIIVAFVILKITNQPARYQLVFGKVNEKWDSAEDRFVCFKINSMTGEVWEYRKEDSQLHHGRHIYDGFYPVHDFQKSSSVSGFYPADTNLPIFYDKPSN